MTGQSENAELALHLTNMANGDRTAFAAMYRALERPVYRFIASKMNDPHEAADILHNVFMDVWRSAGSFEGRSTVKTWVLGIAYRKTMDHFRKTGRISLTDEIDERVDERPDAVSCIGAAEEAEHLRHCMGELKPQHRSAIELAFYEDMTYAQVSEAMDIPEGTVKTRIYHAKQLLLRCLEGRMKEARS